MAANVLLTVDTELLWRADAPRGCWEALYARSCEPAGVGLTYQLALLARHDLKACFFIDPMPALLFGPDPVRHMVDSVLGAGQEVQLHLHPQWASVIDGRPTGPFELCDHDDQRQFDLIGAGIELLIAAGAPRPIAFRAGSYAANDATLRAAAAHGLLFDCSHNGAHAPWPSAIGLPPAQIAPIRREGLIEVPVTVIGARGGLRHLQLCSVSSEEMRAALVHAASRRHPVVTIVSHSFELASRNGLRANRVHMERFETLCRDLTRWRDALPTRHFHEIADIPLDQPAVPMPENLLRTLARQAEQIWSNLVEERAE